MQYLLLIYDREADWGKLSETQNGAIYKEYGQFTDGIRKSGSYVGGGGRCQVEGVRVRSPATCHRTPTSSGAALLLVAVLLIGCSGARSSSGTPSPRVTPAATAAKVSGRQGALRVDDGGAGGLPLLFVHGNGSNRGVWAGALAHFRPHRRAVAFDLRGMGASDLPRNGDYSVAGFAEDVAAVSDALELDRFVLVGHSFGGPVAAAYAGGHPERVAGLVFVDSAGDLTRTPPDQIEGLRRGLATENYAQFTDAWFAATLKNARGQTRLAVLASLHATPREVFVGATLGQYAFLLATALAPYRGPRLSIPSFLSESPFAIHRTLPDLAVREVRDASHWLMLDQPEEFHRILEAFLGRLREPARRP